MQVYTLVVDIRRRQPLIKFCLKTAANDAFETSPRELKRAKTSKNSPSSHPWTFQGSETTMLLEDRLARLTQYTVSDLSRVLLTITHPKRVIKE
jgi:hypothetical protein